MAVTGLAVRHLSRDTSPLRYLNRAVYPLSCLHLPVSVATSSLITESAWPLHLEYLLIVAAGFLVPLALYEWVLRRVAFLGFRFGLPMPQGRSGPKSLT